jgi:ubiquinone/menaquinone biosynthesis C-methylase UbiE
MKFDHFDLLAPIYEKFIPLRNYQSFLEHGNLPEAGRLLDAGGGTGRVAKALNAYISDIVIVDTSLEMLRQTKDHSELSRINSFVEELPFVDQSFDRVIMVDALHHVHSQQSTINELWRVLKPGGRILIEEPNFHLLSVKFVALAERLFLMRSHFLYPEQIITLFNFPKAQTQLIHEGFNIWILVDKLV